MNLESRIAYWVNLGLVPYIKACDLQLQLAELRQDNLIKDVILTTQHAPEINFGTDAKNNQFSHEFLSEVERIKGSTTLQNIEEVLKSKGIGFSETSRGGGATAISPGQLVYYPIVDYEKITGRKLGVGDYKNKIYQIMFNSLVNLGIKDINITPDSKLSTRDERRDVWVNKNGMPYKLGSKGIKTSRNVAFHGFSLYIDKSATDFFWIVKPCGYDHSEVKVISAEEILNKKLDHDHINDVVKSSVKKYFSYDKIIDLNMHELFDLMRNGEPYAKAEYG